MTSIPPCFGARCHGTMLPAHCSFVRLAGVAKRLNGDEYRPEDRSKGLIIACNEAVYEEVCEKLIGRNAW